MGKIGLLTSGGDAPGMNACIRAIVRAGICENHEMVGILNGFQGIFSEDFYPMDRSSVGDIIHRGGTILGTSRCDEMHNQKGVAKAAKILKMNGFDYLIIIGGDGSMKGALALSQEGISLCTIPATIDNDIGYQDNSIGFHTAVETITDSIAKIRDTSSAHKRTNIIEVMGRTCGDLALYAGLAGGAEGIIVPEVAYEEEKLATHLIESDLRGKRYHIILVTEGTDTYALAERLETKTGMETRVTVLGYLQRGGAASVIDRMNGSLLGSQAVKLYGENKSLSIGMKKGQIVEMDLYEALQVPKKFDYNLYQLMETLSR